MNASRGNVHLPAHEQPRLQMLVEAALETTSHHRSNQWVTKWIQSWRMIHKWKACSVPFPLGETVTAKPIAAAEWGHGAKFRPRVTMENRPQTGKITAILSARIAIRCKVRSQTLQSTARNPSTSRKAQRWTCSNLPISVDVWGKNRAVKLQPWMNE